MSKKIKLGLKLGVILGFLACMCKGSYAEDGYGTITPIGGLDIITT